MDTAGRGGSRTTLGYLAARTQQLKLLTVVTAVVYREPGLLAKAVSTLDVLSGGRAVPGISAAWFETEARGLGRAFPPLSERFERSRGGQGRQHPVGHPLQVPLPTA